MPRFVRLNDVWRMLDGCLDGYVKSSSREYWTVTFAGRSYRSIPLGRHGHRHNPEIEAGHIRSLVRFFSINKTCVDLYVNLD